MPVSALSRRVELWWPLPLTARSAAWWCHQPKDRFQFKRSVNKGANGFVIVPDRFVAVFFLIFFYIMLVVWALLAICFRPQGEISYFSCSFCRNILNISYFYGIVFVLVQLQQCIAVSQKASEKIFQFYRDSVRRRYSKTLWWSEVDLFSSLFFLFKPMCTSTGVVIKYSATALDYLGFCSVALSCSVGVVRDFSGWCWTLVNLWKDQIELSSGCKKRRKIKVQQVHLLGFIDSHSVSY